MSTLWQQLDDNLATAVDRARQGLVEIANGDRGVGAGTIWHPAGLIITNAHVVAPGVIGWRGVTLAGQGALTVTLPDGRTLPAQVLATDPARDLAALGVEADDLPTIELGRSRGLRPGEWVLAVGHPWGVAGAVTGGVVIGTGASLPEIPRPQPGQHIHQEWVAVSLHMRPGHSGGPLVDVAGRLVGINTMISGPDVGYAVPVHAVKAFLKRELSA
jgi:serine protease Do